MGDNCDNDDDSDGRYDYLVSNINFSVSSMEL